MIGGSVNLFASFVARFENRTLPTFTAKMQRSRNLIALAIFLRRGYIMFDSGRAEDRFRPSRPGEESPNTRGRDAA
jgi:hypothetical protein